MKDTDQFVLTGKQIKEAAQATWEAYQARGYHTFWFWFRKADGEGVFGEYLIDLLTSQDPEAFSNVWNGIADFDMVKPRGSTNNDD